MNLFRSLMVLVSLFLVLTSVGYAEATTIDPSEPAWVMHYVSVIFLEEVMFTFYLMVISFISTLFYDTIGPLNTFMGIYVIVFIVHVFRTTMSGNFGDFFEPIYKSGANNAVTKTIAFYAILYTFLIPVQVEMWKLTPLENTVSIPGKNKLYYNHQKLDIDKATATYQKAPNGNLIEPAISFSEIVKNQDLKKQLNNKIPLIAMLPWSLYSKIVYGTPFIEDINDPARLVIGEEATANNGYSLLGVLEKRVPKLYNEFVDFVYEPTSLINSYLDFLPKLSNLAASRGSLVSVLGHEVGVYADNLKEGKYSPTISYEQGVEFYDDEELIILANESASVGLNTTIKGLKDAENIESNKHIVKQIFIAEVFNHYGLISEYNEFVLTNNTEYIQHLADVLNKNKANESKTINKYLYQEIAKRGTQDAGIASILKEEIGYIYRLILRNDYIKETAKDSHIFRMMDFSQDLKKDGSSNTVKANGLGIEIQKRLTRLFLAKSIHAYSLYVSGNIIPLFKPSISSEDNYKKVIQGFGHLDNPIYDVIKSLKQSPANDNQFSEGVELDLIEIKTNLLRIQAMIKIDYSEYKSGNTLPQKVSQGKISVLEGEEFMGATQYIDHTLDGGNNHYKDVVGQVLVKRSSLLEQLQKYEEMVNYITLRDEIKREVIKDFIKNYKSPPNINVGKNLSEDSKYSFKSMLFNSYLDEFRGGQTIKSAIKTKDSSDNKINEFFADYTINTKKIENIYPEAILDLSLIKNGERPVIETNDATNPTKAFFDDKLSSINFSTNSRIISNVEKLKSTEPYMPASSSREDAKKINELNVPILDEPWTNVGDSSTTISMKVKEEFINKYTMYYINRNNFSNPPSMDKKADSSYLKEKTSSQKTSYKTNEQFGLIKGGWDVDETLKEGVNPLITIPNRPDTYQYNLQDKLFLKANIYVRDLQGVREDFNKRQLNMAYKVANAYIDYSTHNANKYKVSFIPNVSIQSFYTSNTNSKVQNLPRMINGATPEEKSILESPILSAIAKTLQWVYVPFIDGLHKFNTLEFKYTTQEVATVSGIILYQTSDIMAIKLLGAGMAMAGVISDQKTDAIEYEKQNPIGGKTKPQPKAKTTILDDLTKVWESAKSVVPGFIFSMILVVVYTLAGLWILISLINVFVAYLKKIYSIMASIIVHVATLPYKLIKMESVKDISKILDDFTQNMIFKALIVQSVFLLIIFVSIVAKRTIDYVFKHYFEKMYMQGNLPTMMENFMTVTILTVIMVVFIKILMAVLDSKFFDGELKQDAAISMGKNAASMPANTINAGKTVVKTVSNKVSGKGKEDKDKEAKDKEAKDKKNNARRLSGGD